MFKDLIYGIFNDSDATMYSIHIHRYDGITDSNGEYITSGAYPVAVVSYEGKYLDGIMRDFTIREIEYASKFKIISFCYELNIGIKYNIFPSTPFTIYYYPI